MTENTVEFIVVVEVDHQLAVALLARLDPHLGAEAFADALLQALDIGVDGLAGGRRLRRQRLLHQGLGFPHRQAAMHHHPRQLRLIFLRQGEQGAGVAHAEQPLVDQLLDRLGQFQQAQQVADGDAGAADRLGHLHVGQLELVDQALQGHRLFQRVEVLALDVLDQRDRRRGLAVDVLDHRRDRIQPGDLRRAPAPLAGDQFEVTALAAHHDRLHHALGADGFRQFVESGLVEMLAWLVFAALNPVHGQFLQGRGQLLFGRLGGLLYIADQRSETAAEAFLLGCHDYPFA